MAGKWQILPKDPEERKKKNLNLIKIFYKMANFVEKCRFCQRVMSKWQIPTKNLQVADFVKDREKNGRFHQKIVVEQQVSFNDHGRTEDFVERSW